MKKVPYHFNFDWLDTHPQIQYAKNKLLKTPEYDAFNSYCWPFSNAYSSPLNSAFLVQFPRLELMSKSKNWIIRDGLIPLLWFFKKFPKPIHLKCKLYVEKSLEPFIPSAWSKYFGTYSLVSKNLSQNIKNPKGIILIGIVSEVFSPDKEMDVLFQNLQKTFKNKEVKKIPKLAFLSFRNPHSELNSIFYLKYISRLYHFFGSNIRGLDQSKLDASDDYSGYVVIDLNCGLIFSDNSIVHFLLERGASLIAFEKNQMSSHHFESIDLSDFHSIQICHQVNPNVSLYRDIHLNLKKLDQFQKRYLAAIHSAANESLPWPSWFAEWISSTRNVKSR